MKHPELERKLNDNRFRRRFSRHWLHFLLITLLPLLVVTLLLMLINDIDWGPVPLGLLLIAEFLVCNAFAWYWAVQQACRDVRRLQGHYRPPATFPFD